MTEIQIRAKVKTWEVIEPARPTHGRPRWLCRCTKCGAERLINTTQLRAEINVGCHCTPLGKSQSTKVKPGDSFGSWTVLSESNGVRDGRRYWLVQCVCGKIRERGLETAKLLGGYGNYVAGELHMLEPPCSESFGPQRVLVALRQALPHQEP